jgi:DNA-binding transcriptional LysR family regulator
MAIEIRLLRHAVTLARIGNYARAARVLHVSQPTMSRSIASLEHRLGVRLFDRGPGGVEPTAFGRLLLERGARLLEDQAHLEREIKLLAGLEVGALAVSAGPYPLEISVATAVTRLLAGHPRLKVEVMVASPREVLRDVVAGQVDVGVVDMRGTGDRSSLAVEPLPSHNIFLACRPDHPLAGRRRLTASAVFSFPIASTPALGEAARVVESAGDAAGRIDPETRDFVPAIHVNSQAIARQIAAGTDAVVPGTASMLAEDLKSGRLVTIDFHTPAMRTHYGIIHLKHRTLSPPAQAFIERLRSVESEVVAAEANAPPAAHKGGRSRRR